MNEMTDVPDWVKNRRWTEIRHQMLRELVRPTTPIGLLVDFDAPNFETYIHAHRVLSMEEQAAVRWLYDEGLAVAGQKIGPEIGDGTTMVPRPGAWRTLAWWDQQHPHTS